MNVGPPGRPFGPISAIAEDFLSGGWLWEVKWSTGFGVRQMLGRAESREAAEWELNAYLVTWPGLERVE